MLKTAYIQIGAAFSSFIQSFSNLVETFNTSIALDQKVGFKIIDVSLVLMMPSTNASFFDKYGPIFELSFETFFTHYEKLCSNNFILDI